MLDVTVDTKEFKSLAKTLKTSLSNLEPPLTGLGSFWESEKERMFNTETDPDGNKWADLSDATLASKPPGNTILTRSSGDSALRNTFFVEVGKNTLRVGFRSPIAIYHQEGTPKMPQRLILKASDRIQKEKVKLTTTYLKGRIRRRR